MECGRHGEDEVEVGHGEQLPLLRLDPASLFQPLALGAMPISAGVVDRLLATTRIAHVEVAAQKRRSTLHEVTDHSTALPPELFGWRCVRPEDLSQIR